MYPFPEASCSTGGQSRCTVVDGAQDHQFSRRALPPTRKSAESAATLDSVGMPDQKLGRIYPLHFDTIELGNMIVCGAFRLTTRL